VLALAEFAGTTGSAAKQRAERCSLRSLLGLVGADIDIEFKWNDNMQESGNIMDFYVHGDTAPGGRFNFAYSTRNGITG
jgi:hypothetical protein